ncbi:hypothetical protein PIB30_043827 [Stylosanthes scabra]|uniref:RNase H type-1 domain-containing protein n=1 Tax=Stylosanthes scabra TaxID=79078 RepID=A0ABU6VE28_9FABA|nr:hypothetical protein [Stylosanthes scabra]
MPLLHDRGEQIHHRGYFTDEVGAVKCWMGEEWKGETQDEVHVAELESAVQFLLEDMNMSIEDIVMVSNRKDVVDWLQGQVTTCWETRFLRNKLMNFKLQFPEVEVIYKQENEFVSRARWEVLAKEYRNRWIKWEDNEMW